VTATPTDQSSGRGYPYPRETIYSLTVGNLEGFVGIQSFDGFEYLYVRLFGFGKDYLFSVNVAPGTATTLAKELASSIAPVLQGHIGE
jgi:hypothetical protein